MGWGSNQGPVIRQAVSTDVDEAAEGCAEEAKNDGKVDFHIDTLCPLSRRTSSGQQERGLKKVKNSINVISTKTLEGRNQL